MQRILSEETWQLLQADILQLIELNTRLRQQNHSLLEERQHLLDLVTSTEARLTPVLEQLIIQQDDLA